MQLQFWCEEIRKEKAGQAGVPHEAHGSDGRESGGVAYLPAIST